MLRQEKPNWVASLHAPNPKEVTYWIDLKSNPDGQIVRCYTKGKWAKLNAGQDNVEDTDATELKNEVAELKTSIASKVTSTDVNTIKVVSELPTIQETGVLYIKIS